MGILGNGEFVGVGDVRQKITRALYDIIIMGTRRMHCIQLGLHLR